MGSPAARIGHALISAVSFLAEAGPFQHAALPWRWGEDGLEVMLITSRGGGRWMIPKGGSGRRAAPWRVAAREAFEEAGVEGRVRPQAIGVYPHVKELRSGLSRPYLVSVYPLEVLKVRRTWPEAGQRRRRWVKGMAAAQLVASPGLAAVIDAFARRQTAARAGGSSVGGDVETGGTPARVRG